MAVEWESERLLYGCVERREERVRHYDCVCYIVLLLPDMHLGQMQKNGGSERESERLWLHYIATLFPCTQCSVSF